MIQLSRKWTQQLITQPEAGMGYQIATVVLADGRRFERVIIDSGYITRIKDVVGIPFTEAEIQDIIVTNDKWDFNSERSKAP
jgi:hypothetical protein